jgi:hypothetical protein
MIRRKLHDGALPSDPPRDKIHTGYGKGATCDACDDLIQPAQVEYELNYPDKARTFRLHLGCAGLWEAVRLMRGLDRGSSARWSSMTLCAKTRAITERPSDSALLRPS